jgi:hypothetical protein
MIVLSICKVQYTALIFECLVFARLKLVEVVKTRVNISLVETLAKSRSGHFVCRGNFLHIWTDFIGSVGLWTHSELRKHGIDRASNTRRGACRDT